MADIRPCLSDAGGHHGQRITRAKAKIRVARIPYRTPSVENRPGRVFGVVALFFLVFNEGYLATGPDHDPIRPGLTAEAIRLTRPIRTPMEDGEIAGQRGQKSLLPTLRCSFKGCGG